METNNDQQESRKKTDDSKPNAPTSLSEVKSFVEFTPRAVTNSVNEAANSRLRRIVKPKRIQRDKSDTTTAANESINRVSVSPASTPRQATIRRPINKTHIEEQPKKAETKGSSLQHRRKTPKQGNSISVKPILEVKSEVTPIKPNPVKKTRKRQYRKKTNSDTISVTSANSATDLPLREKLERDLQLQRYACAICMDTIKKHQQIWSCKQCYAVLHISCMKQWIFKYLDTVTMESIPKYARDAYKFLGYLSVHDTAAVITRCPCCRGEEQVSTIMSGCYCGNGMMVEDSSHATMAHSCGKMCGRSRGGSCVHPCSDLCHPGPCHSCSAIITIWCRCGKEQRTVRCGTEADAVRCDAVCGRILDCKEHRCELVCHSGTCPSCTVAVRTYSLYHNQVEGSCYCGTCHRSIPCGEAKIAMRSRNPLFDVALMVSVTTRETAMKVCIATTSGERVNAVVDKGLYAAAVIGDLDDISDLSDDDSVAVEPIPAVLTTASRETPEDIPAEKPFALLTFREAGVGAFSCGAICGRILACQRHRCERVCHSGDCGMCPYSITDTTMCPCGRVLAKLINPLWRSCSDPFPTCGNCCDKPQPCGHKCSRICHTGPCPPCETLCVQHCRCNYGERRVPCWVLQNAAAPEGITKEEETRLREPFVCDRVCKTDLTCKRHKCMAICCPYKGRKSDGSFHICSQACGRILNCGIHTCYLPCHSGDCVACGHVINTPVTCACGKEVIRPPIACGTLPPKCNRPCSKLCPRGHPSRNHPCHFGSCPPCTVLVEMMCEGGHTVIRGIPCYRESVCCGRPCGKPLPCGHTCNRTCHSGICRDDDVLQSGCGQICGKKREFCDHNCQALCHPSSPCPNTPCMADVVVHCPCGRRTESQKCLIGVSGDASVLQDLSQRSLECDSECRIIQRNRRLAEALQVGPALLDLPETEMVRAYEVEIRNCPYTKSTLCCANLNPELVTWLETACYAVVRSSQSQPVAVPQQYACYAVAIADVAKEYGLTVEKTSCLSLQPSDHCCRPAVLLSEALIRFQSLLDGKRLHAAQPLARYATDRDLCTLFIHNRRGSMRSDRSLLEYLKPYLPSNQYKIRSWLRPDGLLIMLTTEEMARRVKHDLEMRDAEFDIDFWAEREDVEKLEKEEEIKVSEMQTVKKEVEKMSNDNSYSILTEENDVLCVCL